jgi:hypothetical protein
MDILYKIEVFLGEHIALAWNYVEPHSLELVIFLVFATFFMGIFQTTK